MAKGGCICTGWKFQKLEGKFLIALEKKHLNFKLDLWPESGQAWSKIDKVMKLAKKGKERKRTTCNIPHLVPPFFFHSALLPRFRILHFFAFFAHTCFTHFVHFYTFFFSKVGFACTPPPAALYQLSQSPCPQLFAIFIERSHLLVSDKKKLGNVCKHENPKVRVFGVLPKISLGALPKCADQHCGWVFSHASLRAERWHTIL